MADKPGINDVMGHLDKVPSKISIAKAGMWGAIRGTAPIDRWDHADADLKAAATELEAARDALAEMDKQEPYCTVCGQPILSLMTGWSHFNDNYERTETGHEPKAGWRPAITEAERSPDIHTWFGLTYSSYLVLPRTLLQSMPEQWQRRFTGIIEELQDAFAHVPQAQAYKVTAAEEREVNELSAAELETANVGSMEEPCGDPDHDHGDGSDCLSAWVYTDLETGRQLESWERVLVPVPDPVPAYNRGRTRIEPAPSEEAGRG